MVAYLLISLRFFPVIFRSLFPTFLVGSSSFALLDALPVRSSGLSGALVALPGSLLCLLPGFRSLSSQFPVVGLVLCFLPCGPAPGLSLFGLLAVPPFLLSRFVAVCFAGLWISLFPGRLPCPGLLFPGSRNLQLPSPWYSRWHLDPAFCSSGVLHPAISRLVSCFCFLGRLFRQFSWFQGFLSYFSDLVFCRSQYLFPLRCFAFTHVVSVPFCSQILYLVGSSSVFLGGVQPSPPVSRLSLGWPTRAISILRLSIFCSVLGGSALHVFLLLAFDPLGWLLVLSPYPWSTRSFCWSVPTLPSCSVVPPGSPRLALPLRSGVLLPGCTCSVSSVCISSASFLSCSSGVLRPGSCFPWVVSSSMVVFVLSSHVRPLWFVICCLSPVWLPHLGRGSVVSSVFVSYAVCLCRLCS